MYFEKRSICWALFGAFIEAIFDTTIARIFFWVSLKIVYFCTRGFSSRCCCFVLVKMEIEIKMCFPDVAVSCFSPLDLSIPCNNCVSKLPAYLSPSISLYLSNAWAAWCIAGCWVCIPASMSVGRTRKRWCWVHDVWRGSINYETQHSMRTLPLGSDLSVILFSSRHPTAGNSGWGTRYWGCPRLFASDAITSPCT